jgi:predicted transcriptional regulator
MQDVINEKNIKIKKLPSSEFDIMKVIWALEPPVTVKDINNGQLDKEWKAQTILTLLHRLVEKGFLNTDKNGKERIYSPIIEEKDYLEFETGQFIGKFHDNSLTGLMNTLYDGKNMDKDDLDELMKWLNTKR